MERGKRHHQLPVLIVTSQLLVTVDTWQLLVTSAEESPTTVMDTRTLAQSVVREHLTFTECNWNQKQYWKRLQSGNVQALSVQFILLFSSMFSANFIVV